VHRLEHRLHRQAGGLEGGLVEEERTAAEAGRLSSGLEGFDVLLLSHVVHESRACEFEYQFVQQQTKQDGQQQQQQQQQQQSAPTAYTGPLLGRLIRGCKVGCSSYTLAHKHSLSYTLSHTHTLSYTHSLIHTLSHTYTHSLMHTLSRTHFLLHTLIIHSILHSLVLTHTKVGCIVIVVEMHHRTLEQVGARGCVLCMRKEYASFPPSFGYKLLGCT
jgi:hypothetical protein